MRNIREYKENFKRFFSLCQPLIFFIDDFPDEARVSVVLNEDH